MTRTSIAIAWPLWTFALLACAGSTANSAEGANGIFARIQVEEARVDHSGATIADVSAHCVSVHAATRDGRDAQLALCNMAHEIGDADALVRCERAERAVESQQARAHARCGETTETR
jgi:hypothetical protein